MGSLFAFFMLTQHLQFVQGYSPLESGVRTLPNAAVLLLAAGGRQSLRRSLILRSGWR